MVGDRYEFPLVRLKVLFDIMFSLSNVCFLVLPSTCRPISCCSYWKLFLLKCSLRRTYYRPFFCCCCRKTSFSEICFPVLSVLFLLQLPEFHGPSSAELIETLEKDALHLEHGLEASLKDSPGKPESEVEEPVEKSGDKVIVDRKDQSNQKVQQRLRRW